MGRGRGSDEMWTCGGICCFILMVVSAGLIGGSFKIVEPLEYGLWQNTVSKSIDETRVYLSGRYFVGLARGFITFPRTNSILYFGASQANADGAAITVAINAVGARAGGSVSVECAVEFKLRNTTLIQLYREFGTSYRTRFAQAVTSAIQLKLQDASNGVAVDDFYSRRSYINQLALEAATAALSPRGADVTGLQIRRVTLPADTERAIVSKLVSLQAQLTASSTMQQSLINSATTVLVQTVQQAIDLYVNNQTQAAAVIVNTAAAQAKAVEIDAAATAFTAFGANLGFNNAALLRYIELKNVLNLPPNATVLAEFGTLSALVQ